MSENFNTVFMEYLQSRGKYEFSATLLKYLTVAIKDLHDMDDYLSQENSENRNKHLNFDHIRRDLDALFSMASDACLRYPKDSCTSDACLRYPKDSCTSDACLRYPKDSCTSDIKNDFYNYIGRRAAFKDGIDWSSVFCIYMQYRQADADANIQNDLKKAKEWLKLAIQGAEDMQKELQEQLAQLNKF